MLHHPDFSHLSRIRQWNIAYSIAPFGNFDDVMWPAVFATKQFGCRQELEKATAFITRTRTAVFLEHQEEERSLLISTLELSFTSHPKD